MSSRGQLLVIGENIAAASTITKALAQRGWKAELAPTKQDGFKRAIVLQPDAVLTELSADHSQPLAVARALRTCVEHDVIVVAFARGALEVEAEARAAGFDAVFEPPLDLDRLASYLESAVAQLRTR